MSRRLKLGTIVALLALASGSGIVLAGAKSYAPLSINTVNRWASGGFSETHNTTDLTSYAECGSNSTTGYCTFRDTAGTFYSCYTTDPAQITVIRSMSPDSLFNVVWDASGVCTYVLSYASSRSATREH
jgi:hypothetical protein